MKKYEKPMVEKIVLGVADCVLQEETSSISIETHSGTSGSSTGQLAPGKKGWDDEEDDDYGW